MTTMPAVQRLGEAALGGICGPAYDRSGQTSGIVHFGIGAFARAHLAWFTDKALAAGEQGWMITGVSLRSPAVMAQLNPQQGLYSLTERDAGRLETRIIGSIREVLVADRHTAQIIDRIADPACHIISFTVTEKGYCRAGDGSLDQSSAAAGFYPLLGQAIAIRAAADLPGLTLLSCDNLPNNGQVLEGLMRAYLADHHPAALDWFTARCTCPASMVDRIVPAMTAAALDEAQALLGGTRDEGAIFTEGFSQWVIEDRFAGPHPAWDRHGAQLVSDVSSYEAAKLRMLNGAHSLLAYCGLDAGYRYVHEAIADPRLRALALQLMLEEAAPTIAVAADQDLPGYAAALLARFENPALNHALLQIAMDGSQKIPQRWLAGLAQRQRQGLASPAIMAGLISWLRHVRGDMRPVDDPLADQLAAAWTLTNPADVIHAILGEGGLVPSPWRPTPDDLRTMTAQLV